MIGQFNRTIARSRVILVKYFYSNTRIQLEVCYSTIHILSDSADHICKHYMTCIQSVMKTSTCTVENQYSVSGKLYKKQSLLELAKLKGPNSMHLFKPKGPKNVGQRLKFGPGVYGIDWTPLSTLLYCTLCTVQVCIDKVTLLCYRLQLFTATYFCFLLLQQFLCAFK